MRDGGVCTRTRMAESPFDFLFKIVLVGDSGTGKTSLVAQYTSNIFADVAAPTIGVDFSTKRLHVDGKTLKLTLWDTAGQERFRTLTSSYYRGCHGVVLTFDVGARATFDSVRTWLEEISVYANRQHLVLALVGTKMDTRRREVSSTEAELLASNEAMTYSETSAKTGAGVDDAFSLFVRRLLAAPEAMRSAAENARPSVGLALVDDHADGSGRCMSC